MANTTNLNLGKLGGSEKLKNYPTTQAGNMDIIDAAFGAGFGVSNAPNVNASINNLADGLAIVANGNTHAAITSGQYVYVRNHGSLSEGLYTATANISANATLSGSNLTADSNGGLNALNSNKVSGKQGTWLPSNGYNPLTSETGYFCYSTNQNYAPSQGIPTGYSQWGKLIGDCGANYKFMEYIDNDGKIAIWDTNNSKWETLSSNLANKNTSSTDLNSYTGNNDYVEHYKGNSIKGFTNVPPAVSGNAWPFVLDVYRIGAAYTKQVLHIFLPVGNPPYTYIRQQTYMNNQVVWGDWYYTNLTKNVQE